MSNQNRITALKNKHAEMEISLQKLEAAPAAPESEIIALKKSKLLIKDEIERISLLKSVE